MQHRKHIGKERSHGVTGEPLWAAIAATLRTEIATGAFRPGDRLPSEAELSRRFGVNRHTLRRAVSDLIGSGLLRSRQGAGVFVAARPTDYPLGPRVRFHQNLAAAGRVPGRQILSLIIRGADRTEAEALSLAPGDPVHVCEGVSLADAEPFALFRSSFPASRLPALGDHLRENGSVTRALCLSGVTDYTRAVTRLTAEPADAVQAARLQISRGAPLIRSISVNHDPKGQPVEYGITWFAGDRVMLIVPGTHTGQPP